MLLDVCFTFLLFFLLFSFQFLTLHVSQSGNNIGDDGALSIAAAMRVNSSVQKLWLVRLCCCMLLDVFFTLVSLNVPFLFQSLYSECFTGQQQDRRRRCQSYRRCDAREQQRAEAGPCAFALLNSALRLFHFCFAEVSLLFSFLALNGSQSHNKIGDDGAIAIAAAMRVNSSVQELWLVRLFC